MITVPRSIGVTVALFVQGCSDGWVIAKEQAQSA